MAAVGALGHIALILAGAARFQIGESIFAPLFQGGQPLFIRRTVLGGAALGNAVQRCLRTCDHSLKGCLAVLLALRVTFGFARFAVCGALGQPGLARLQSLFKRVEPRRVSVIRHMFAEVSQSRQSLLNVFLQPRQPVRPLAFGLFLRHDCTGKGADEQQGGKQGHDFGHIWSPAWLR